MTPPDPARPARPAPAPRTPPVPAFAGAVLAGGQSRRMGRNKALLRLAGEPLWRRQLRLLREAGAQPVLLVQAPGQRALRRDVLRDTVRDAGPLAGLHAALTACPAPLLAVLAVDLPALDAAWLARLAAQARPGRGVVLKTARGYEPLAALYPREALPEIAARLARRDLSLQACIAALVRRRRLRVLRATPADEARLANWNTPADRRLAPPPRIELGSHV